MEGTYRQTIEALESAVKDLNKQGIKITALDQAVKDLKTHYENIESIEKSIDAIKDEITDPINKELKENRVGSRYSVIGYRVGAVALIFSAISMGMDILGIKIQKNPSENMRNYETESMSVLNTKLDSFLNVMDLKLSLISKERNDSLLNILDRKITTISNSKNEAKLNNIDRNITAISIKTLGYYSKYNIDTSRIFVEYNHNSKYVIYVSNDTLVSISCRSIGWMKAKDETVPYAKISFKFNCDDVSYTSLKQLARNSNSSGIGGYDSQFSSYTYSVGDEFWLLNKYRFKIVKIVNPSPGILNSEETRNGVFIKRII